jgi:hypothetical protein
MCLPLITSCDDAAPQKSVKSQITTVSSSQTPDQQVSTVLSHNFGIVQPGQIYRHRFMLQNNTAKTWTFSNLIPSCSCTVASTTAPSIAPGSSESVEIEYTSPNSNQNDRRKVGVQFAEAGTPMFWLEIHARIRQPISIIPDGLTLNRIGRDSAEGFFDIYNYTNNPIQFEAPRCKDPWLEPSMTDVEAKPPGVIQVWRVVILARTSGLRPGRHRGEVLITSRGSDFKKAVSIDLELIAPIRPIPSRLFFGSVARGKSVERKISLLLSSDLVKLKLDDFKIEHDLGDRLRMECSRSSPERFELKATLMPGEAGAAEIDGTVRVMLRNDSLTPIIIPVIATIEQ